MSKLTRENAILSFPTTGDLSDHLTITLRS